jgi:hypothetical protein
MIVSNASEPQISVRIVGRAKVPEKGAECAAAQCSAATPGRAAG